MCLYIHISRTHIYIIIHIHIFCSTIYIYVYIFISIFSYLQGSAPQRAGAQGELVLERRKHFFNPCDVWVGSLLTGPQVRVRFGPVPQALANKTSYELCNACYKQLNQVLHCPPRGWRGGLSRGIRERMWWPGWGRSGADLEPVRTMPRTPSPNIYNL